MKIKNLKLNKFNKKKLAIILGITVFIIALSSSYVLYNTNLNLSKQKLEEQAKENNVTSLQLDSVVYQSGFSAGQDLLDKKLEETNIPEDKANIYISKATLMSQSNDLSKALEYAYSAESLYPNEDTAMAVASLEEAHKNNLNAIKYYQLYLERLSKKITSDDPQDAMLSEYNYYKKHLDELKKAMQ